MSCGCPVISIVDDDPSVRVATKRLVCSLGYTAHAFESADAFLQSAHLDETACLIVDVQMPGLCGTDLQDILIARGKSIPIIFITAFPDESLRTRVVSAGAIGFLGKPCDVAALVRCIENGLNQP